MTVWYERRSDKRAGKASEQRLAGRDLATRTAAVDGNRQSETSIQCSGILDYGLIVVPVTLANHGSRMDWSECAVQAQRGGLRNCGHRLMVAPHRKQNLGSSSFCLVPQRLQ